MKLILASTSPYRIEQLKNFGLEFQPYKPKLDEEALKNQIWQNTVRSPKKLCEALAKAKALSLREDHTNAWIIGADQLVNLKGQILGKPGTRDKAIDMLKKMSGRTHQLITSVALVTSESVYQETVIAKIKMRKLSRDEILETLYRDSPLDCAGSYKFEKSGFRLIEKLSVTDPSSLIGIPLLSLSRMLRKAKIL